MSGSDCARSVVINGAAGAVGGLVGGAVGGKVATALLGRVSAGALSGATGSGVTSAVGQYLATGEVDWRQVGESAALGFGFGAFGGRAGAKASGSKQAGSEVPKKANVVVSAVSRAWSKITAGAKNVVTKVKSFKQPARNATKSVRFGPMNPGPLADEVANTFRSSSYTMSELSVATTLYRVYGGKAGRLGLYWSRVKPSGPLQAQLDSALNPAWGNSATSVATIRVPSGTTIYEGAAASQPIGGGGSLLGGGSQVYIPRVDLSWLVPE